MADSVSVRELALEILIEVNEHGQYSHLMLRDVLDKYQYLEKTERAFLTRLVEGTLERQIEMDYILDSFSKVKVRKMKPLIRNLLRMSVYQLKYMDKVPDSAVCNEAVKLAGKRGFRQLSGFVNGVLRNIARQKDHISYPKEKTENYSVRYSIPKWMVEMWMEDYGEEKTKVILEGFFKEKSLWIRTNLTAVSPDELYRELVAEGITVERSKTLDYAFAISGFDHLSGLLSFQKGLFYVQDISSMMVAETAAPKEGDYVIDVCAAPGGKSTHIAEKLKGTGMVEARDLTEYKVSLIEENIERHRLKNMKAVCMDATVVDEASVGKADILVCDLPCSGLGVMGKKTDIRYKMTPEKQKDLVELQREILSAVEGYLKDGGTLVYSTCTIHKQENEENVKWFLEKYPQYSLVSMEQMLPGETSADGFFIARLLKNKEC
ncbi:MAG: 16S rRNA (cytosine(967)-C(5))-methyltransferase RsmB [Agathobacter sp.]|nr:16S rRNA (cytosine(967)-C(5))-methyltransferase RsmB [Agathobacter sp.]MBQ2283548.1 16S rRNA (cytosine(967)-C(5))-methyltransferase RsmB [Agathobacter sp.]